MLKSKQKIIGKTVIKTQHRGIMQVPRDVQALVHELQTHQIELEEQNEELRRAQQESEVISKRYAHLYESAPVGYAHQMRLFR